MTLTYLVPASSQSVVREHIKDCHNLGLLMARYVPYEVIKKEKGESSSNWLQKKAKIEKRLLNHTYKRWELYTAGAMQRFTMSTGGRLIVGLGYKGALEIGITLQFVTGLPVIPGSALKGAARSYGLLSIASQLKPEFESDELDKLDDELDKLDEELSKGDFKRVENNEKLLPFAESFHRAFGSQDAGGICIFYDSVVSGSDTIVVNLFEADVMTGHFPKYYNDMNRISENEKRAQKSKTADNHQGPHAPSDDQSPNPITFLTVAPKTTFAFAIGLRHSVEKTAKDEQALRQAAEWLRAALENFGVGAKTAAGYGWFENYQKL